MPIDPEVAAEVAAIKSKILKMETDLAGISGAASADIKKEIRELRAELAELVKTKPKGKHAEDPGEDPNAEPRAPADDDRDPVADLIDGKD